MAAARQAGAVASPGPGVDVQGAPVFDPTRNVLDLVRAAVERIDDLRAAWKELSDVKHAHEQIIGKLREEYQEKISRAEAGRLDSIRQVDREEVAKTAVAANTAITTLAKQTTDLQQTLAKQVTDTAAAQEARNSAQYSDINKRISALELSSSEGKGKLLVSDPQTERLAQMVEKLVARDAEGGGRRGVTDPLQASGLADVKALLLAQAQSGGHRQGAADSRGLLTWALAIVVAVLSIYTFTQRQSAVPAPQVIVVPAGTTAPGAVQTGPSTQVPR